MAADITKAVRNNIATVSINSYTTSVQWEDDFAMPDDDACLIEIAYESTATDAKGLKFTVKAGDYWGKDLGDFSVTIPTTVANTAYVRTIGPLESYRFRQSDGKIKFTIGSAATSAALATAGTTTVKVFQLPNKAVYAT